MAQKRIPPVKYVTLFPGRTGSTYLASHMQTHPEIVAKYEILGRRNTTWEQQQQCLRELFEVRRWPAIKAVGFKTKIHAVLNRDAFTEYIHEHRFRIIHQIRRNHLKFIVSVVRAKMLRNESGRSNLFEKEFNPIGPMEIPEPLFARAKARLNVDRKLKQYIDSLDLPKLVVIYEDLLAEEQAVLNQVWDFLDVSHVKTQGITRKNTPDDIREAVTNLDEILKCHPEMSKFVDQD